MKHYIIASDVGGSGTKSMIYDIDKKKSIGISYCEAKLYHPDSNAILQDPQEIYYSVIKTIKELLESKKINGNEIEAIIIDGIQGSLLWVDENHKAVSSFIHWLDSRYTSQIVPMKNLCGEKIFKQTGTTNVMHAPEIMWWKKNNPVVYKNAYKMVLIATFIGGLLSGLKGKDAYIDDTSLGWSGLTNKEHSEWDKDICDCLSIDINKLPKIVKPTKIIGRLCKKEAMQLNLPDGIPIIAGSGDFTSAAIGSGVIREKLAGDIAGTASLLFWATKDWKPDETETLRFMKSPIDGLWYTFAIVSGGGCLRWFRDSFFDSSDKEFYKTFDEKSKKVPIGNGGLVFYPYIGRRHQPLGSDYRGAWLGINWTHKNTHFYRAILESVAFEYKRYIFSFKNIVDIEKIYVFGGGSLSSTWNQIKADVLGIPYHTLKQQECSLYGSALIGSYAIGAYKNLVKISSELNRTIEEYIPNHENTTIYNKYYKKYLEIAKDHDIIFQSF